ncbi:MAG: (d)CMP kinase [Planctomycetia bacterium]|nr:(d)CMP kinase [Planctomycetia bacterium]
MIVTLDGPAGAGKSSAARALAERLGWCHLDTGAMYRTVALVALERGVPLDDAPRLAALTERIAITFRDGRVLADGRDVSAEIRTERVTQATRFVADAPPVREAMKRIQRRLAQDVDVVTEGRDQGTEVFPHAEVKVFLTASPEERARRRHREEADRGAVSNLESVRRALVTRDEGDRSRPVGAMRPAADAVVLDTDGLSRDEVVERLAALVKARRPECRVP